MESRSAPRRRYRIFGLMVWLVILGTCSGTGQVKSRPSFEIRDVADSSSGVRHVLKDREGDRVLVGDTVFFSRADLKSVKAARNPEGEGGVLNITWRPNSAARWKRYTASRVGKKIAIIANGEVLATPKILDPILRPGIMLSLPGMDMQEAAKMAADLSRVKH